VTPEFEFLCAVVRPARDGARASELADGGIDWARVLELACTQGVNPHVYQALVTERLVPRLPRAIADALGELHATHVARSLWIGKILWDLTARLQREGIAFATFKGPALALLLYGDLSRREFNDVDLVIRKTDLPAVTECLRAEGFEPRPTDGEFRTAFFEYQGQIMFVNGTRDLAIDVHWEFTSRGVPFPLSARDVWNNLRTVPLAGADVPTLGTRDTAMFLAGHGTKERWRSLGWVCDLADFIAKHPDFNWMELWGGADDQSQGRSVLLGFYLADRLLGAVADLGLVERAAADGWIRAQATRSMELMNAPPVVQQSDPEAMLASFNMCETLMQKLVATATLVITRTVGDFEAFPLPRSLWGLYYLLRPFRLGARATRGALALGRRHVS
jgi:hypothetical protein